MKAASAARERRAPVPRDRYRAVARRSGVAPRLPRRPWTNAVILVGAGLFVLIATPRAGDALSAGVSAFGASLSGVFTTGQGSKAIDLPGNGATVTADPVAQDLPDFTKEPALTLNGRVPTFALASGRVVDVSLNGTIAATLTPDATGAFSTPLTLRDGPNAIALTLRSATDTIATSSYTVVLDRIPPVVSVTKPIAGATVDGPNVAVEGKADPGSTVVVNDRTVVPAQDGSFSTSFTATAGPLTVTVVARDRAGNETTVKTPITVRDASTTAALAVSVTLDNTRVTPGQQVLATIRVTANGQPKSGQLVTLSVGVITIGSATTDATGTARIGFAAPPNEGTATVVVLAAGTSGSATLTVAK